MERGKNQMPGFGSLKDGPRGFVISNLTDHDHIGVCAYRAANCTRECVEVLTHLALFDRAPGRRINELDRVLNSQDVVSPSLIDMFDQTIDRCGFAAAGRTSDQDESLPPGFNLAQQG